MPENKKQQWKGGTLLNPLPAVMVSCGSLEKPNIITIGWTGIICSDPPKTYISVRPERYSYELIKSSEKFVINLTTEALVKATDYCGVRSGREHDKFKECNLTAVPAFTLEDTPVIAESPVSIECKVFDIIKLGSHDMFMADILSVDVADELLDKNGALRLDKAGLISYVHGDYFTLGRRLGDFGFSVRKKPKNKPVHKRPPKKAAKETKV